MELAAVTVVVFLCCSSAACWAWLVIRWRTGSLTFDPRIGNRPPIELLAVCLAGLWIAQSLFTRLAETWAEVENVETRTAAVHGEDAADAEPEEFDPHEVLKQLREHCLLQALLVGVMLLALSRGFLRPLSEFGIAFAPVGHQIATGIFAATLAWLPVLSVVFLTSALRTVERQHTVLRMLDEDPRPETWFWAVVAAVMVAPVVEELLFRVVLQGWLVPHVKAPTAIGLTAILFSAVHGFPDSLALIPLALILGCTYYWRISYVSIVTAHAVFNGTMLLVEALQSGG